MNDPWKTTKNRPLRDVKKGKEMTLDLLLTQDQGSSIVDGINHLRNLLLSIDLFLGEFLGEEILPFTLVVTSVGNSTVNMKKLSCALWKKRLALPEK